MEGLVRVLYVGEQATARSVPARLEREDRTFDVERVTASEESLAAVDPGGVDCVVVGSAGADGGAVEVVREALPDLPLVVDGQGTASRGVLAERVLAAVGGTGLGSLRGRFPDVALVVDESGRHVEAVAGPESGPPYDEPEELVGRRLDEVLPADAADRLHETVTRALETGGRERAQYRLDTGSGTRWFEACVASAGSTPEGRRQAFCVVREVTEREERETALEALHEMSTTIQTADTVDVACERTVATAADILDFALCSVVLRDGDWLVPRARSEDAPPDGVKRVPVDNGLAGKTLQRGESYVVDEVTEGDETDPAKESYRSGLSVPIGDHGVFQAVSTEPGAFDDDDIRLAELLVSHTRTAIERIEREETLTRKTERLEEFASFVSHDLRNPLNVATARLELARGECDSEHLDDLERALDRMERLVDDLLTLARQGETIGETEAVGLAPLVRRAWENVETGGATLSCESDRTIRADRGRLATVLENLVRNAVEHAPADESPGDGTGVDVTVSVGELVDGTGFYIADDGTGIPADERETVFESGYSTAADGTGFGLTIVRDIVAAHGWDIEVTDSEAGGARFEITGVERVG